LVKRDALALRLADLVADDEVLRSTVEFLESRRASPGGSGGRVVWHLDRAGRIRAVEITAGIYQVL